MQSAKIAHYSLPSIMLDTKSTTNSVEQNERLLLDTSHVFSSLAILPRQQSLELSGYLRHSDSVDSIIPLKLLFSFFLSREIQNLQYQKIHVIVPCTDDYNPYPSPERYYFTFIIFYSRNLWWLQAVSIWLTFQLLIDLIGTLLEWYHSLLHMRGQTLHLQHILSYLLSLQRSTERIGYLGMTCTE